MKTSSSQAMILVGLARGLEMELEDVLRRNAELEEFLERLVKAHAKALQDQSSVDRLDVIRKDILICFNDLETLNEMLISCDGQIREEIDMLQKCKVKIAKLVKKRRQLIDTRDQWKQQATSEVNRDSIPLIIDASYRSSLERYTKLMSAGDSADEDMADGNGADRIWKSLDLLYACRDDVSQSIKQAAELLHEFRQDKDFIEKEIRNQSARVRRKVSAIDDEIRNNSIARRELLAKVGLSFQKAEETSTAQRLLHLNLNSKQDKELELEEEDIANHAEEFIDIKIASLQDQLTHKKEKSSSLADARDLWDECIHSVERLEERIKSLLAVETSSPGPASHQLKSWIGESLQELTDIINSANNKILIKLVTGERDVIEKAFIEMLQSVGTVEAPPASKINTTSPPFLVASKSPPKIGVSDMAAQRLSIEDSVPSSSSLSFLKDKAKKKE